MIKQNKNEKATKLTPEELEEFRETYEGYQKAVFDLGTLSLNINIIKKQLDDLNGEKIDLLNHIDVLIEKQTAINNKLGDKYGVKQVDLETGELK
jgi:predicted double-glycine peptidase